jgi:ubiquinone/menaquinone biosynthesis C-methylase UbiE
VKWSIELTLSLADFQHEMCKMLLDNKLHVAPIVEDPRYVLDVATGTGIWAIEFGKTMSISVRNYSIDQ